MDQDVWNRDDGFLTQGVRMVAAAVLTAAFTATLVIAVGQQMVQRRALAPPTHDAVVILARH